ncbi:hypothetical protein ABZP36_012596 [Zizania latifolia]
MEFGGHGVVSKLGFAALTCNSALAMYRSRREPASAAFVAGAYAAVVLLLHSLRRFERAGRAGRGRIKVAVWLLTALLTAMFAARVAPLMPPPVAAVVWLMSAATVAGGFWAIFLSR